MAAAPAAAGDIRGEIEGNSISVGAEDVALPRQAEQPQQDTAGSNATQASDTPPTVERTSTPNCDGATPGDTSCASTPPPLCGQTSQPELRLYERGLDPVTRDPVFEWQMVGVGCPNPEDPATPVANTAAAAPVGQAAAAPSLLDLVTREWQTIQIPAATIGINPANGRTLVNFDTIFYTTASEQEFPVTLLGQSVVIHAVPVEYVWHHGDGTSQSSETAGDPYPSKEITHQYQHTGTVTPRVDITYRGEFTVNGGERQPIPGTANVAGTTDEITILEAHTQLVDG